MRKLIVIILAAAMLLCLCGCNSFPITPPGNTEPAYDLTPPTDYEYAGDARFWGNYEKSEDLPLWYQVSGKEIYMDVPKWNFQEFDETDTFRETGAMIAITVTDYVDFSTLETMRQGLFDKLRENVGSLFEFDKETVCESETINIHGIDFYRTVSKMVYNNGYPVTVTAYSFVLDGVAVNVCGIPMSEAPTSAEQKKIEEMVRQMAMSVRDTYEWSFGGEGTDSEVS